MTLDDLDPLPPRLAALLRHEESAFPLPIGRPGYTLPDLADAEIVPLVPGIEHAIVTVTGSARASGNVLILMPQSHETRIKMVLTPQAHGNVVIVGRKSRMRLECDVRAARGVIVIGEDSQWKGNVYARLSSDDESFFLGRHSKVNGIRVTIEGAGRAAVIGEDCMFANSTEIRTSDLHGLVSMDTGAWLNEAADVLLEPHVWLGQGCVVLKGTRIGYGAVVGARAVVTRDVPRFTAVAGSPARIVRRGVSWDSRVEPGTDIVDRLRAACAELGDG